MPVNPDAEAEVTGFAHVPPFAAGLVRDLRVRWALEEIGRDYCVRLIDAFAPRSEDYLAEQPFGQVPVYRDKDVQLFESGAILIHLGLQDERLLPADPAARSRAIAWLIAALNSIEPTLFELITIDLFGRGQGWTAERRPQVVEQIGKRLGQLEKALAERDWFEGRFTIGDLMMVTVLRQLRHTDILGNHPRLAALKERGEARPAFRRALADQLAGYDAHQPEGAVA